MEKSENSADITRAQALQARLAADVRARVQDLKFASGIVRIILDVAGLDAAAREQLDSAVKAQLGQEVDVDDIRVAMIAEKPTRVILAVGSGKGGVGKSTLAANLAVALARQGRKVGLVDADVYGPSQPRLLASEGQKPEVNGKKLVPIAGAWGVPMLSMGHLVEPGQAVAWRGPMASNALLQLVEGDWGDTQVLVLDLPPGTGDLQLTMLQKFRPSGAVIVSTPQDLALMDAERAIQLFEHAKVPIVGFVENMAGYACPHCGEISDPFGSGGVEASAHNKGYPFLGKVPLDIAIRKESDAGRPPAASDSAQGQAFVEIAARVGQWLDITGG